MALNKRMNLNSPEEEKEAGQYGNARAYVIYRGNS